MKLIVSDGRELTVRDVGPPLVVLRAGPVPLKENGWRLVEDDEARVTLRGLLDSGHYERLL